MSQFRDCNTCAPTWHKMLEEDNVYAWDPKGKRIFRDWHGELVARYATVTPNTISFWRGDKKFQYIDRDKLIEYYFNNAVPSQIEQAVLPCHKIAPKKILKRQL